MRLKMRIVRTVLVTIALVALGIWMGGMIALGPIAAPIVFRMIPAPMSGDAMTTIFRRFDRVAVGCVAVVLMVEMALAMLPGRKISRVDVARVALAALGAVLAIYVGLAVSPHIEELHRAGAIRGLGLLGTELQRTHVVAERLGQSELALAVAVMALHAFALGDGNLRPSSAGGQKPD